ncbi:MAG: hypothetical protein HGB17_15295 [Syntrophobacteraceae bacterium]|nr:hypothetical protein [Syntrophobacteraceae bacterium]
MVGPASAAAVATGEGFVPVAVEAVVAVVVEAVAVVVVEAVAAAVASDRHPSGPLHFSGRQVRRIIGTHRARC